MSGSAVRVSIPAEARPLIANIKAFGCNHGDHEIYAMLKECNMDLNETAQKLLLQDPFHEVKRKRDPRKENVKEPVDSKWRPAGHGRGGRGGCGSYSSRGASNDEAGGRTGSLAKDNGAHRGLGLLPAKGNTSSLVMAETERKLTSSKLSVVNGPNNIEKEVSSQALKEETSASETRKRPSKLISSDAKVTYAKTSGVALVPSLDTHNTGEVGNIRREVGSQLTATGIVTKSASRVVTESETSPSCGKGSFDGSNYHGHGKVHTKLLRSEANQISDASQVALPSFTAPPSSRPSSNYSNRSQQLNSSQKVVSNKEWKPKSVPSIPAQYSAKLGTSDAPVVEAVNKSLSASESVAIEETTSKIEKKMDEMQLSDRQHVIIPDHIQVSEDEIKRLNFGSFDASFIMNTGFANAPDSDKSVAVPSDTSQEIEDNVEQLSTSIESVSPVAHEQENPNHPHSSSQMPENQLSGEAASPDLSTEQVSGESKQEPTSGSEAPKFSVVQTASSYPAFGLVPQMVGSHFAPFENSDSQACDSSSVPGFVVQHQFDPATSSYAQFYRPTTDTDARFSPFLAPGGSKYNGTNGVLPAQAGQSLQETGSSIVLPTTGSIPLAAQGAGAAIPTSIAVPQQPVPVFRQPAGLHISHYPPNYLPYGQYFSPFFLPPPSLHHFLGSSAFPQQAPSGNIFPPVAAAATTPVKYSLAPYKPGNNPGNSTVVGVTPGFGNYNSGSTGYTSNTAANNGNSAGNEDRNTPQFKDNNVYIQGHQNEASAVWIPTPGRGDVAGLQASSFYSIPPQGQHVTFAPSQAAHGGFNGIYHPSPTVATTAVHPLLQQSQTGAGEMVSPPTGIYQQPHQRSQVNWTNNY